jgi:hypothetical protein
MKELYAIEKSTLKAIAEAIRQKKGTALPISVSSFAQEILSIETKVNYVIKAGSYTMTEFHYGVQDPKLFSWESEFINGTAHEFYDDYNEIIETYIDFNGLRNDGEYCVYYMKDGVDVGAPLSPSWSPSVYSTEFIFEEDQNVSEGFKYWFDACFVPSTE